MSCGQIGYKEMRRQNLPYPSIWTIYHMQGLKCKPDILQKFLHVLKIKVSIIIMGKSIYSANIMMSKDVLISF